MASAPRLPELEQPNSSAAIERTFEGFRLGLRTLTVPQLMALAADQAARLEAQRQELMATSLLSASASRNLDLPVLPLPTMELPSRSQTGPVAAPSPFQPPYRRPDRSSSGRLGRELAGQLVATSRRARRIR